MMNEGNMMKFLKTTITTLMLSISVGAFANNVAVWNSVLAVTNSNYAKNKATTLQASITPKQQQLKTYQNNIEKLQQQYSSQKDTMTDVQKADIRKQIDSNLQNYDQVAGQIESIIATHEQDILDKIAPKIKGIQESIIKQKNIDVLIDNRDRNVTFVKPEWDITDEITKKINEQVK